MSKISTQITNSNSESLLLINSLVGTLAKAAKEASLMRVDHRYCLDRKVLVGSIKDENQLVIEYEAWGGDISNNGIALFVPKELESGRVYIALTRLEAGRPVFMTILVRRCQKLTENIYRVGATFIFEDDVKP